MTQRPKRAAVIEALNFRPPAYVPWSWDMTERLAARMKTHLGTDDLETFTEPQVSYFNTYVTRTNLVDPTLQLRLLQLVSLAEVYQHNYPNNVGQFLYFKRQTDQSPQANPNDRRKSITLVQQDQ